MASMPDMVLAGVLPKNAERLDYALTKLSPEHFPSGDLRVLWGLLSHFKETYKTVLTREILKDRLERNKIEPAKIIHYLTRFDVLVERSVSDSEFAYAVSSVQEDFIQRKTGEVIATGFEILETGAEVAGVELKGSEDAQNFIRSKLAEIDMSSDVLSEGDVRDEEEDVWQEYLDAKESEELGVGNVRFGIPCLDEVTNGIHPGELILIAAFTSAGKSHMLSQTVWNAVVTGKNAFLATSETVREQMRRRIFARHTRLPKFGVPEGLDTKIIKEGRLSEESEQVWREAIRDLTTNPDYGHLKISQIPRRGTLGFVEHRATLFNKDYPVDVVAVDSLQLLQAESGRKDERESMNEILKDTKVWASSFDGRGIPIITPWQMSRNARNMAAENGGVYSMASLADTSEAEKSASLIVSMYKVPEIAGTVNLQILKNRDAPELEATPAFFDYRNSFIGESTGSSKRPARSQPFTGGLDSFASELGM